MLTDSTVNVVAHRYGEEMGYTVKDGLGRETPPSFLNSNSFLLISNHNSTSAVVVEPFLPHSSNYRFRKGSRAGGILCQRSDPFGNWEEAREANCKGLKTTKINNRELLVDGNCSD